MAKSEAREQVQRQVGYRVMIYRMRHRLSANELGRRAGVHGNTVANVEAGQGCTIGVLAQISEALGIEIAELFKPTSQNFVG
jgi:transcriptional regulator with XRE-family HTH domain